MRKIWKTGPVPMTRHRFFQSLHPGLSPVTKVVEAKDECYQCAECGDVFGTNFEMNMHLLKDHANFSLDFPENIDKQPKPIPKQEALPKKKSAKSHKLSKPSYKKTFKCLFKECGHSFDKFTHLKRHFDSHRFYFSRLLSHIYRDCTTEAALNQVRTLPHNKLRQMSESRYRYKTAHVRNHNVVRSVYNHKKAVFNSMIDSSPRLYKKANNGNNRYVYNPNNNGRTNGSALNYKISAVKSIPIVSTPDIHTQWDNELIINVQMDPRLYSDLVVDDNT